MVSEFNKYFLYSGQWRRQGGGADPGVTISGWHHIMMRNHNSSDLWRIPFFFHLVFIWTKNSLMFRRRPFFWSSHTFGPKTHSFCSEELFFWSSPIFGTKKGCHHEISPRVPPSLATPLILVLRVQQPAVVFCHLALLE